MIETRRNVIPRADLEAALRLIHLDWLSKGASPQTMSDWLWNMDWFPHLKWAPEIVALAKALPDEWQQGELCDPQILLQFPHNGGQVPEIEYHIDKEPEWATGRRYARIVGVPLSNWNTSNGGVRFPQHSVCFQERDAIMFTPEEPHSGGVNLTGHIRYGVYFRWLR